MRRLFFTAPSAYTNNRMKVVAIVGLSGAGKSEVARLFEEHGFERVRFGDLTDQEVRRRGLKLNESNERLVREDLRKVHGMAAYAKLNLPRIETARQNGNVVIDGLYSWEEYRLLKSHFGENFYVVAVWASPKTRYRRLAERAVRPLSPEEAASRDAAEIENLNKGGPIAMADFTIANGATMKSLAAETENIFRSLYSDGTKTPGNR
ncbi:MAG: AAA family ATPase [Chloroflexota bacterium]